MSASQDHEVSVRDLNDHDGDVFAHEPDPEYQLTGYTGATFRMVGVDLNGYLGAAGVGTIEFYIDTEKAVYSEGTYNASGQSGANFGSFTISPWAAYAGINNPPFETWAFLEKNGKTKCQAHSYIYHPGSVAGPI